jgi:hypothetical protein
MKNKVVGGLVAGAWAALLISACTLDDRVVEPASRAGAENAGTSGSGGSPASAGSQASAGNQARAGMGSAGDGLGGASADAGAGGEMAVCEGAECADCAGATPTPGTACGECGTQVCNPDQTTTSCSDPKFNACGGCAKLVAAPDTACGECGKYECAADKQSVTCKDPGKNACGGCGVLANAPNSSCGSCGDWQCTADKSGVQCSGVNANACGGCGTLANAPGVACGECGKYECSVDKASTTCKDPGKNACGGCSVLTGTLNAACGAGNCGKLACSTDKNSLICSGGAPNACGGCSALTPSGATKGASCGTCSRTWACNPDLISLSCAGTMPNVCGGCSAITGTLGASCGACSVTACSSDKNSLVCNAQCTGTQVCVSGLNQCKTPDCTAANSCGKSDGAGGICTNAKGNCPAKPNSTVACAGSSCTYTCATKTLSCSTAAEPACGTWNFESKTPEGWYLDTTPGASDAVDKVKGLYLVAPPGTGGGSWSLAVDIDGSKGSGAAIALQLCGGAPATGLFGQLHAKVWFKPSDGNGGLGGPGYTYLTGTGVGVGGHDVNCPAGVWFDAPSQNIAGTNVTHAHVTIGGIAGHKGTLYFDNIYFD